MKTVLLFGTFDFFHIGHLQMLKNASKYGDKIIVSVARDVNVKKIKKKIPFHNENERKKILEQIKIIDEVRLGYENDPYKIINEIKPDIIALGYDQKIFVENLVKAIDNFRLKTKVVRLKPYYPKKFKSSKIRE